MSALLTADWFHLDSSYRKFDLYSMYWNIEEGLDNVMLSGAPYGGPIATVRHPHKLVKSVYPSKPVISIYNCAGRIISKIIWNSGNLLSIGWSNSEHLTCVQDSGDVLMYDMFGAYQRTFSMGAEARDTKVIKAQLFPSPQGVGLGIITKSNRMFLVNNIEDPKVRLLPYIPRANEPISCWCVLSTPTSVIGFLVCRDQEVYRCQLGTSLAELVLGPNSRNKVGIDGPFLQILSIVPSQNGRNIAMYTDSGLLCLASSDFKTAKYCEIDTGHIKLPKEMMWCGTQAVVIHWDNFMVIYGLGGDSVTYPYDGPFHLIAEVDCVRVVSDETHEMIQKVPVVMEKIFKINSTAPASYLLEASKQFQKRSHQADEYLSLVKPHIEVAVQDCIDAAAFEFRPDVQKSLVRAAQYGKCFVSDPAITNHYVQTCHRLRVLNAVRDPKVAMPLTCVQYQNLGETILLDRLVWRRLHFLAKEIAEFLKMKDGQTRVLSHWALYKVSQPHLDNETAAQQIAEKLQGVPGISYTSIALKAAEKGRKALAIKMLEKEPRTRLQVPLLLQLGEGRAALLKATESGDTDLLRVVLQRLEEKMGKQEFELTIRTLPLAYALYVQHCAHNREALRKLHQQGDDFACEAATHLRDALELTNPGEVEASLIAARECYKKGKNELGAAVCEDARKLIKQQSSLQTTYGDGLLGVSLHDTVAALLSRGEVKLADKLRSEHRMSDRKWYWLRILALAAREEWGELERLSRAKRPPVGLEVFVDACLGRDRADEALKYLPRCQEHIRVKYYVKAGFYEEAAQEAFEQRDRNALLFVQSKCPLRDTTKHSKIAALLEQLPARK